MMQRQGEFVFQRLEVTESVAPAEPANGAIQVAATGNGRITESITPTECPFCAVNIVFTFHRVLVTQAIGPTERSPGAFPIGTTGFHDFAETVRTTERTRCAVQVAVAEWW